MNSPMNQHDAAELAAQLFEQGMNTEDVEKILIQQGHSPTDAAAVVESIFANWVRVNNAAQQRIERKSLMSGLLLVAVGASILVGGVGSFIFGFRPIAFASFFVAPILIAKGVCRILGLQTN